MCNCFSRGQERSTVSIRQSVLYDFLFWGCWAIRSRSRIRNWPWCRIILQGVGIKFSTNLVLKVLTSYKNILYDILFLGQTHSPIGPILGHLVDYSQYCVFTHKSVYPTAVRLLSVTTWRGCKFTLRFSSCCRAHSNYTRGILNLTKPGFGGTFSP
jgi:hypothetical protein